MEKTSSDIRQAENRFKGLLRELFQFAREDLNFGIYRIMNQKRAALEDFIETALVGKIDAALQENAGQRPEDEDVEAARQLIRSQLGGDGAFDADGRLKPEYHGMPAGKVFLILEKISQSAPPPDALRLEVFNRLYDFFSRYYDDGDFMCKRRYAAKDRYAVPYNGEEVVLHWANKDQYYIKTAEHFARYVFKAGEREVRFIMRDAALEKDNNKAREKKYFIPMAEEFSAGADGHCALPFEYRPLTAREVKKLQPAGGAKANGIKQEDIVSARLAELPADAAAGIDRELLHKHVSAYVKRNTADFFIHQDLRGFLQNELMFFINSELLPAEEMTRDTPKNRARYKAAEAVRQVAGLTIDFIAQLEDYQKAIWEKKKFITETHYCVTLCHLPNGDELLPDVAACDAQWEEWQALNFCGAVTGKKKRLQFLRDNPTLVIDTAHFAPAFKDKLLAAFDDLDGATDGVLFHSENWQALNLMQEKFHGRVKCVYIDPPYNTGSDFIYKDQYRGSSWLALIHNRLQLVKELMADDSGLYMQLDHYADYLGRILLQNTFPNVGANDQTIITWNTGDNISGFKTQRENWIRQMDKILFFPRNPERMCFNSLYAPCDEHINMKKKLVGWLDFVKSVDGSPAVEKWEEGSFGQIEVSEKGKLKIKRIGTVWNDIYSFQYSEPRESESFSFKTQKPENLLRRIIQSCSQPDAQDCYVLDAYAGIGTTGAVSHKIKRKYVLIEMGDHFNTLYYDQSEKKIGLLGRMKIVLRGDKNFSLLGKPRRPHLSKDVDWRGGGMIKYHRIESYDDALENIEFDDSSGGRAALFEDYTPRYMLLAESRHCATFADPHALQNPFAYTLKRAGSGAMTADVMQTFVYLTGMREETRRVHYDGKRRYVVQRGVIQGQSAVVIWRDVSGWKTADYEQDREFIKKHKFAEGAERLYVNDNSHVKKAESVTPLFARKMFGVSDE